MEEHRAQDAGVVRVIAGAYARPKSPARMFAPINLCDVNLRADVFGLFCLLLRSKLPMLWP